MSNERDERVKERAYEIWESEGRPSGQQDAHWERARREIEDQDQGRKPGAADETKASAAKRGAAKQASAAGGRKPAGGAAAPKSRGRSKSDA